MLTRVLLMLGLSVATAACNTDDHKREEPVKAVESLSTLSKELGLTFPPSTRLGGVLRSSGMDDAVRFKLEMNTSDFPPFLAQTGVDPELTRPNMQGIFGPDRDFWDPHQVQSLRTGQVKRPDARALHVGYGETQPGTTVVYVMEHGT
jgi:hypothetical protein